LDNMIAELDQNDPRWQLDDLEADRLPVPLDKNSAMTVDAAETLLPMKWDFDILEELEKQAPPFNFSTVHSEKLTAQLKDVQPALHKARELKDFPTGRFSFQYEPDFISTLFPHISKVQKVGTLLHIDIYQAVLQKNMTQAWESSKALLNCGRSLSDEPQQL